jgi:hypothetical protein
MDWVRARTIPAERPPLVGEVIANFFGDRGCHVVSVTDPYGRILGFLDRSRYFSIKYLLSWVSNICIINIIHRFTFKVRNLKESDQLRDLA